MDDDEMMKRQEEIVQRAEEGIQDLKGILKKVNKDRKKNLSSHRLSQLHKYTDAGKKK